VKKTKKRRRILLKWEDHIETTVYYTDGTLVANRSPGTWRVDEDGEVRYWMDVWLKETRQFGDELLSTDENQAVLDALTEYYLLGDS
jgi:uncharacterized protein YaeQ